MQVPLSTVHVQMFVTHQTGPKRWDWLQPQHRQALAALESTCCQSDQGQPCAVASSLSTPGAPSCILGRTQASSALHLLALCRAANREKSLQRGSVVQLLSTDQHLKTSITEIESHCHGKSRLEIYCWWGATVDIGWALQAWPWAQIFSGQPVPRYCTALCVLLTLSGMEHVLSKRGSQPSSQMASQA